MALMELLGKKKYKQRIYQREYYEAHKDEIAAYQREYRDKNREAYNAYMRVYMREYKKGRRRKDRVVCHKLKEAI